MSDVKSKLPDLKEISSMAGKLFHGIKSSVQEIIEDYKEKRTMDAADEKVVVTTTNPEDVKSPSVEPIITPPPVDSAAQPPHDVDPPPVAPTVPPTEPVIKKMADEEKS